MNTVLLVEDEAWLGELYCNVLGKGGFNVVWRRDGYDAIEVIDQKKPDVILLDLMLPWANGIQLLHELASNYDLADIPAIIFSNTLPQDVTLENLRYYGVAKILDKATIKPKDVIKAIAETIDENS
ncbi:MAG: response regulator [Candidatus Woesebacteria bacterium]|jgi:CheY-like chemotaxis protein